jgi:hypothetical protein
MGGITWIRNGVVTDRPREEDSGPDGRQYLSHVSKTYYQDGTAEVVTGHAFNSSIELSASGSYTHVLGAPTKTTEATDHTQDSDIQGLIKARTMADANDAAQKAQKAAAVARATNLVPTGSVPGRANYSAVVKPTKS